MCPIFYQHHGALGGVDVELRIDDLEKSGGMPGTMGKGKKYIEKKGVVQNGEREEGREKDREGGKGSWNLLN